MNTVQIIVDRFEGNYVVVELPDGTFESIPASILPNCTCVNAVIDISINFPETKKKLEIAEKLVKTMWKEVK